jgi:hypothetical protein
MSNKLLPNIIQASVDLTRPIRQGLPLFPSRNVKELLALLALSAAMAAPLKASTVIDSFNDGTPYTGVTLTNGVKLSSVHGGGVGWTGGFSAVSGDYEQSGTGVIVLYTNDQSVAPANYVSGQSGPKHFSIAAVNTSSGTARRAQTRHTPTLSIANTIWFSCVVTLLQTNGDAGLLFNPNLDGAGNTKNNGFQGFRVGLGSVYAPGVGIGGTGNRSGSLGIGPICIKNGSSYKEGDNSSITNWTSSTVGNGVVIDHAVPTNGTPGLVLGCIYYDTNNNSYPRIDVWYNPDVPNKASLPAPTITYTDTNAVLLADVTDVGFQVVRSSILGRQNEVIDNVKLSDETNGFEIVYLNAPLPTPVVNVSALVPVGSESGPTNIVFNVFIDRLAASPVTVNYVLSGTATNGYDGMGGFTAGADYTDINFNVGTLTSSVTIPTGQSNVLVTIFVINDLVPEGNESVICTALAGTGYILGLSPTATGIILDNNDANVSVQYMFESTLAPQVWDPNLAAAPAVTSGIGGASYDSSYVFSSAQSFLVRGNLTTNNEADAVANGNYMGVTVGPVLGRAMTLTNLQFQAVYGNPFGLSSAQQANIVVRSSLDNFTADLANFVLSADNNYLPSSTNEFSNCSLALDSQFANLPGAVEFRLYFYDDTDDGIIGVYPIGVRLDNLFISGGTSAASAGVQRVSVVATITNAALPSTQGQFTITRTASDTSSPLTVHYYLTGTAGNGSEYVSLPGSATIAAGQTNVTIPVIPLDNNLPEPTRTVVLNLAADPAYGILFPSSDTVFLAPNGDLPGLVTYFYDENNNGAASLAAVAAGQTAHGSQVVLHNAAAGAGLGLFGANGGTGVGHGYGTSSPFEGQTALYLNNFYLDISLDNAIAGNDYFSYTLSPASGYAMTLTNFTTYAAFVGVGQSDTVVLRSSADNFTTDLGTFNVPGTSAIVWNSYSIPINITNDYNGTEFRLYIYTTQIAGNFFRLDQTSFQGTIGVGPIEPPPTVPVAGTMTVSGANVTVSFTGGTSDTPAKFHLQSAATVNGPYTDDNSAVITGSGGTFQVTTSMNGAMRFYRIRR